MIDFSELFDMLFFFHFMRFLQTGITEESLVKLLSDGHGCILIFTAPYMHINTAQSAVLSPTAKPSFLYFFQ